MKSPATEGFWRALERLSGRAQFGVLDQFSKRKRESSRNAHASSTAKPRQRRRTFLGLVRLGYLP
jgi:hypothetical protein